MTQISLVSSLVGSSPSTMQCSFGLPATNYPPSLAGTSADLPRHPIAPVQARKRARLPVRAGDRHGGAGTERLETHMQRGRGRGRASKYTCREGEREGHVLCKQPELLLACIHATLSLSLSPSSTMTTRFASTISSKRLLALGPGSRFIALLIQGPAWTGDRPACLLGERVSE